MHEFDKDNDTVDPRVHIELEKLNKATDEINKLEVELDEYRNTFRQLLYDNTFKVDTIRLKLGICVERARPYYEARFIANDIFKQTQDAAMKFERANSAHSAAREMVYLAEQGLGGRTLDPAWQEMLNHATQRVNEAERDRGSAEIEHRIACMKNEASIAKVQNLQKELKRAIAKSSISIRRSFLQMNNILSQHELIFLPYYEMKAHFNQLLEQHMLKVQVLESQVTASKMTYAGALHNLEQISDEIHRNRRKASLMLNSISVGKQKSLEKNGWMSNDAKDMRDEYPYLPLKIEELVNLSKSKEDDIEGYTDSSLSDNGSLICPLSYSEKTEPSTNQSSKWTEINLDNSSPENDILEEKLYENNEKSKPSRPKTQPNPKFDEEFSSIIGKMKIDTSISKWISRSSPKSDIPVNNCRRHSLDNILGPTGEKVREIFSQGIMMLNISSLSERRNSEPKIELTEETSKSVSIKKPPSPLENTLTYVSAEDDNSDTESLVSVDVLNEDQIVSLMLDANIVCEQVLGTTIAEAVALPQCAPTNQQNI